MDLFSKKTLLSSINGAGIYGAASASQTVKFAYADAISKVLAASKQDGTIYFAADTTGAGGIWVGGELVSSKVLDYSIADSASKDHGQKTVTLKYIGSAGVETKTFDLIDEAALKAYFAGSKTIALNDSSIYEVITDGKTILVDNSFGLKSGLKLVYVPAAAAHDEEPAVTAHIALSDNNDTELYHIDIDQIIGNGILDHSTYDKVKNELHLFFKTDSAGVFNEVVVPVGEILDINDIFIKNDSSIYLTATADTSVMNLGVLTHDVSTSAANATGLADAYNVKQYVDAKSSDLAVKTGHDTYIDSSIDANDNKKVLIGAQIAELAIAAGTAGDGIDSSLSGIAGKLVDAADAASKVQSFVNARLDEEIQKLDASIDSTGHTFIEVGVAEVNGKVNEVVVHETIGSITGTASSLTGETGLIDGAAAATAITTYVEGKINALDTSVSASTTDGSISFKVEEENGLLSGAQISYVKAQTTFTTATDKDHPATLTSTDGLLSGAAIADIVSYVNAKTGALDSSVTDTDAAGFVTVYIEQQDGALKSDEVTVNYGSYNYTAGTHTFDTATDGIAKVADTQTFVQDVIESLDLASNVSDASAIDASNFVKTTISETDGIVKNESVEVTYATVTAAPGDITVSQNGIVKGDVLEAAIEGALKWTVLS